MEGSYLLKFYTENPILNVDEPFDKILDDTFANIIPKIINPKFKDQTNYIVGDQTKYIVGDYIFCKNNIYKIGIFNGMSGKIIHIYKTRDIIYKFEYNNNIIYIHKDKLKLDSGYTNYSYNSNTYNISKNNDIDTEYIVNGKPTDILPLKYDLYLILFDKTYYIINSSLIDENFILGYILSIHRAQGSEAKNVVLIITSNFICNQLLYTGITRAKEHCTIICNAYNFKSGIYNTDKIRYSNIAYMIDNI